MGCTLIFIRILIQLLSLAYFISILSDCFYCFTFIFLELWLSIISHCLFWYICLLISLRNTLPRSKLRAISHHFLRHFELIFHLRMQITHHWFHFRKHSSESMIIKPKFLHSHIIKQMGSRQSHSLLSFMIRF